MRAQRAARAFWPLASVSLLAVAAVRLSPQLPIWAAETGFGLFSLAILGSLAYGLARFASPSRAEAFEALDASLPHRPISALLDQPAASTPASLALWQAHLARAEAALANVTPVPAPWALARYDRFGLRYIALMAAIAAFLLAPSAPLPDLAPEGQNAANADGALIATSSWEGWITPPAFTGEPVLYLPDQPEGPIDLPQGSRLSLRFYDEAGALSLSESISGNAELAPAESYDFAIEQEGSLVIKGAEGAEWTIGLLPDFAPEIRFEGERTTKADGSFSWPFVASDDYGVTSARAIIALDLEKIERRFGLAAEPSLKEPILRELPLPFAKDRKEIAGVLAENLSEHVFAGLPVKITLEVTDAAGQVGQSAPLAVTLPGKRFFQPVAKAVGEIRRDLLWSEENAPLALDLLRASTYRAQELFTNRLTALRLAHVIRELGKTMPEGPSAEHTAALASQLWKAALQLEEGTLADARARLERAKERLAEAMRSGASPEEIAALMEELRAATDAYLDLLAENATPGESTLDRPAQQDQNQTVTQDQIQAMMDRIEELMKEGRMAEAADLMAELSALLENLQMQESEGGEGRRGGQPDQQLQDSLKDQQDLADDAFRELQEEFSRNRRSQSGMGQSASPEDEGGTEGQSGIDGQEGQSGADNSAAPDGEGGDGPQGEGNGGQSLAERQQALRAAIEALQDSLPQDLEGEALEGARDALGRAQEAMEDAEDNLAAGNLADALQDQAEALDALREGLSALRQAMKDAQNQGEAQEGGEGEAQSSTPDQRDPLGRRMGQGTPGENGENILPEGAPRRQAEDLREELRRRAGERERSETELDYLRRLLDSY